MEKSRKPKIRFKGYNDDWEQRELGEYVSITSGEAPSKFEEGTELYVKVDDLNYNDKYVFDTQNKVCKHSTAKRVTKGSIIFPKRGAAIMTNKVRIIGIDSYMDTNMMALTSEKLDSEFLYNIISKEGLYKIADTSTIPQINNKHVEPYEVTISSLDEQRRIGAYFKQLDILITLHQRKLDKLINVKKSMLEKMFPKQGSKVPNIRFAGFADDWEQRKVGELLIERNQQAPMSEEYPLMAFVANEGVTPKGERYDRSALVTDTKNKLYKKTEFGDFIYSSNNLETGSIGLNKYGKACISPVYSIFKPIDIADSDFLGRRLVRKDFINTMVKWRQGVIYGQWRIHESDFLNIDILVPVTDEQQRIGKLLDDIDHLITLHQRKLEKLKNIKKSMLEKMFI